MYDEQLKEKKRTHEDVFIKIRNSNSNMHNEAITIAMTRNDKVNVKCVRCTL